ncbi:MAG: ABC transporter permease [Acidobacteriota bacterium]
MKDAAIQITRAPEGDVVLTLHDALSHHDAASAWKEIVRFLGEQKPQTLSLDITDTQAVNSTAITLLRRLRRHCAREGIRLRHRSVPEAAEYLLRYSEGESPPEAKGKPDGNAIASLGKALLNETTRLRGLVDFIGVLIISTFDGLLKPQRFYWKETLYYAQLSGSNAMPIIFLLCFLLGLVMAFQAAVQLRQFGANIYVADLVSLALTRELGPVFTALILAGRSGSAYAAELGTMKVNEETDALTVMGFDLMKYLVLPKVFALAFCAPLLTMWANVSGIIGGVVVGVTVLDVTPIGFLEETYSVLSVMDVAGGLLKSVVFGILIGVIGCFRGLQTGKGADSVGRQTTSAVVSGIFLIIFADAIFTILFHVLGW